MLNRSIVAKINVDIKYCTAAIAWELYCKTISIHDLDKTKAEEIIRHHCQKYGQRGVLLPFLEQAEHINTDKEFMAYYFWARTFISVYIPNLFTHMI